MWTSQEVAFRLSFLNLSKRVTSEGALNVAWLDILDIYNLLSQALKVPLQ